MESSSAHRLEAIQSELFADPGGLEHHPFKNLQSMGKVTVTFTVYHNYCFYYNYCLCSDSKELKSYYILALSKQHLTISSIGLFFLRNHDISAE